MGTQQKQRDRCFEMICGWDSQYRATSTVHQQSVSVNFLISFSNFLRTRSSCLRHSWMVAFLCAHRLPEYPQVGPLQAFKAPVTSQRTCSRSCSGSSCLPYRRKPNSTHRYSNVIYRFSFSSLFSNSSSPLFWVRSPLCWCGSKSRYLSSFLPGRPLSLIALQTCQVATSRWSFGFRLI